MPKLGKLQNSKRQGTAGLGAAIAWFTAKGYVTCIPLTDSQGYDLVVEMDSHLSRIQVKTTCYQKRGKFVVNLKLSYGNKSAYSIKAFNPTEADYLFVLTDAGDQYLIPTLALGGKGRQVTLTYEYDKFRVG